MLYYGLVLLASTKILLVCLLDGINSLDTSLAKTSESHNCESVLQTNTHSRGKISSHPSYQQHVSSSSRKFQLVRSIR